MMSAFYRWENRGTEKLSNLLKLTLLLSGSAASYISQKWPPHRTIYPSSHMLFSPCDTRQGVDVCGPVTVTEVALHHL